MNRNFLWSIAAVGIYWLAIPALGTEWTRNAVAVAGIVISFANVLRYLPHAWAKYWADMDAGEWRMLMGIELFWLGFGARESWLIGDRLGAWDAQGSPMNGFFAYWILCAGLLCYSAASDPVPRLPHQNGWIIAAVALTSALIGALGYRVLFV